MAIHYPKKISNRRRAKKVGFLSRMATTKGRKMINRKRKVGRSVNQI